MQIETMSDDALMLLRDRIDAVIAERSWKEGDKAFWKEKNGMIVQGVVAQVDGPRLRIKRKGELMWSVVIAAGRCRKSLESASALT